MADGPEFWWFVDGMTYDDALACYGLSLIAEAMNVPLKIQPMEGLFGDELQ